MVRLVERAAAARGDALMIGHLLRTPLATAPRQEIVFRDEFRYTYAGLRERIGRLADALRARGVAEGSTVAVLDWDSHRYLECYFAVPMMGAVLQTVNVRLSPEQVAYTLEHARAEVVLVHRDFVPLFEAIRAHAAARARRGADRRRGRARAAATRRCWRRRGADFPFADFDENAVATTFYTTGTTGLPKAVSFTHRQIVIHTLAVLSRARQRRTRPGPAPRRRLHAADADVPRACLGRALRRDPARAEAGLSRAATSRRCCCSCARARASPTRTACRRSCRCCSMRPRRAGADLAGWKINIGGSALNAALARRALSQRHRRVRRLRHVRDLPLPHRHPRHARRARARRGRRDRGALPHRRCRRRWWTCASSTRP